MKDEISSEVTIIKRLKENNIEIKLPSGPLETGFWFKFIFPAQGKETVPSYVSENLDDDVATELIRRYELQKKDD